MSSSILTVLPRLDFIGKKRCSVIFRRVEGVFQSSGGKKAMVFLHCRETVVRIYLIIFYYLVSFPCCEKTVPTF